MMNKFAKTVLIISAIALVVGGVLVCIGIFNGAKLSYSDSDFRQLIAGTAFSSIFY